MSTRVYVAATEAAAGKSAIALGVVSALTRQAGRVGVFRPIVSNTDEPDPVLTLLAASLSEPMDPHLALGVTYDAIHAEQSAAMEEIVARFHAAAAGRDAMVVVGSDFSDVPSPTEFSVNAELAANLEAPMLLVVSGADREPEDIATAARVAITDARAHHAHVLAVVANRVTADPDSALAAVAAAGAGIPAFAVPDSPFLRAPTVRQLLAAVDGTLLYGDPTRLDETCQGLVVAAMTMPHVLDRLVAGGAVVVPGDREDVVLGVLLAHEANTFPTPAALFLNGGFSLSPQVQRLIDGLSSQLPVIGCAGGTMATTSTLVGVRGYLDPGSPRKLEAAERLFTQHIDSEALLTHLGATTPGAVTPLMFEQQLITRARAANAHIVLPEGNDDRILDAADRILHRGAARLTILGDPAAVRERAGVLGLDLEGARLLSTEDPEHVERYSIEYARLRGQKGVTVDMARDIVTDVSYFGTMMVLLGEADGMVSGAAHTTAHTIRPALEVIKTVPDVSVVSSVFLMCLADRVLVYGDCAVNPEPTAEQLADIAISSALTAAQFGVDPRVAMLSYSTGSSGTGADVEKVRAATELVRARAPHLLVEGPIQYDAAVDPAVAATKLKGSPVAGAATVFVFPDLNTGNNTYKAVQRSAGAVAIGPVLQGLRRPVNDLSRGALVRDIVNTIAITAIQAGASQ
ncbi:MAG TPA: phosphate acetyltransferase [Tetrasphaera sp.]|uniref:phosphate acetyltransferase n=1 Tax=Nostocoides sp. TaxID=1917966 RepID=UPI002C4A6EA0|nr:phosphate acetyltransferase [Tetrasphaera sp.]HNQ07425.1 phosphate acetyltransferase [Tetrasphaera sp.]